LAGLLLLCMRVNSQSPQLHKAKDSETWSRATVEKMKNKKKRMNKMAAKAMDPCQNRGPSSSRGSHGCDLVLSLFFISFSTFWQCLPLVVLYRLLEICARFGRVIMRALVGLAG